MTCSDFSRRDFFHHATAAAAAIALTRQEAMAASRKHEPIKIGQIGVGHSHAKGKMEAYRQSSDYEVIGIVEPDESLLREAEQEPIYQGLQWMSREQLLNSAGLQAVAVETGLDDLLPNAEAAAAAGIHIHLDKPPGSTLSRFRGVLEEAARRDRVLQMGYMYRYNPGIVLLKEMLKKGWLGDIFEIHTVMSKSVGESKRRRWAELPGGTMFELGCHLIDLVVSVLGQPLDLSTFNQHSSTLDDGLLDNMLSVLTYPRATATIRSSALEVEGFDRRHFVVCGSEGTLHIQPLDDPAVRLALDEPRSSYTEGYQDIDVGIYQRYVDDAADFAKIIRGVKETDYPVSHDLAVQATVLRACELPLD